MNKSSDLRTPFGLISNICWGIHFSNSISLKNIFFFKRTNIPSDYKEFVTKMKFYFICWYEMITEILQILHNDSLLNR